MSLDPQVIDHNLNLLTPRQVETMRLLALGFSFSEIGHKLGCHEKTARRFSKDAYARLSVDGHAGAWAAIGWLDVPSEPVSVRRRRGYLDRAARSSFITAIVCSWKKHIYDTKNGVTTCRRRGCGFRYVRGTDEGEAG